MRLLVAPHNLAIGGSQLNAIDLAAGAAAAGHDVIVYGPSGPLEDRIGELGLEYVAARPLRYRPAPSRIAQLAVLARRRRIDLIHAYEWSPCLDAYYGAHLGLGVPLVCTVLSMSVSPLVPASVPLVMGTAALGAGARRTHKAPVWVLEPPVDADADNPDVDGARFRKAHGIAPGSRLVASVSRLPFEKLDALVGAIDAVDLLAERHDVRLMVGGGGAAEESLRDRGASVNRRRGREVVTFTGPLPDPRPLYAAADVVVGMGGSALRAMSLGRPVVVQGERGFCDVFEPATRDYFLRHGFWGTGDGEPMAPRVAEMLDSLLGDPARRAELGAFGRDTVVERFSLTRAIALQLEIYDQVRTSGSRRRLADAVTVAARALSLEVRAHDPRHKRVRRRTEQSLLDAARGAPAPVAEPVR